MEITLQGKSIYNIQNWTGKIDIDGLKLFQLKRLIGAPKRAALFKKLIKIFKSDQSPIKIPESLDPMSLDLGDFTQVIIGLSAMSKGRSIRKTYICPFCKAEQPRVIDMLKVFVPNKPIIEGGLAELDDGEKGRIVCKHIRVQDYIKIHDMIDETKEMAIKNIEGRRIVDFKAIRDKYGKVCTFNDEEDVQDFCEALADIGLIALRMDYKEMPFENKLKWLFDMSGDVQLALFEKISTSIAQLSASVSNEYNSKCTACQKEFSAELEPEEYFFDSRQPSSLI